MKRSPLKRRTPLKRSKIPLKLSKLRKRGKQSISKIQRKLWQLCKEIIRKQHGNACYTCGASGLTGSNWHTGHMWPKASLGAWLKYDLRVLRPQCYNCNINRGGMGADFWVRMVRENGQEYMDNLKSERQVTVKAYEHYISLIPKYEFILKQLVDNSA